MYHTPIKYLITISPEKSAHMLTELAEGKPGIDWKNGETYSKGRPMSVNFKDNGTVAKELWERSEQLLNMALS